MSSIPEPGIAPSPAGPSIGRDGEQSRAIYPEVEGFVERDGMRLFYEVYGRGEDYLHENPSEKRVPFAWLTDASV